MIDAHFHIWQLQRADYGWLTPALAPIYRDVGIEDWQGVARPCGVRSGVLVQAAPSAAETAFLLQSAQDCPGVLGVVGWADLLAPDAVRQIEQLARQPRLKGLRPMLHDLADPDWILQPAVQPALRAMADCGLSLDALVRPLHLPRIRRLAQRYPELRIVLDHAAKPRIGAGDGPASTWAWDLRELAQDTPVFCKLSGLWTEAAPGSPVEVLGPCAASVLELFGARRVLWGSDWPVLELAGSYADWHAFARAQIAPADHADVFEHTARRAYAL